MFGSLSHHGLVGSPVHESCASRKTVCSVGGGFDGLQSRPELATYCGIFNNTSSDVLPRNQNGASPVLGKCSCWELKLLPRVRSDWPIRDKGDCFVLDNLH